MPSNPDLAVTKKRLYVVLYQVCLPRACSSAWKILTLYVTSLAIGWVVAIPEQLPGTRFAAIPNAVTR